MFGALTRIKEEWHPARLLCVRFNVAHPYQFSDTSTTNTARPAKRETGVTNVFAALESVQEAHGDKAEKTEGAQNDEAEGSTEEIKAEKENMGEEEEEMEETAAETAARLRENHATGVKVKGPANPWE